VTGVDKDVRTHLDSVTPSTRRRDASTLVELMQDVTGLQPRMWTSIIGFGLYHYKYASGREGDAPAAAFAPRKQASTIYLADGASAYADQLARLGPHTTGVGCLYIKKLDEVDLAVLKDIITRSYATVTDGVFGQRAHDNSSAGGQD
jgi:Domain of unknown function (DU1801)